MSVDGTDFRIAMPYVKEYYSYKFKKCGLRYEVGINIQTGDICWWYGPFEPGEWNDEMIFKSCLEGSLEPGERVETDKGYRGCARTTVNCPPYEIPSRRKMCAQVRSRHETCNARFKSWNILVAAFRHGIYDHQLVFGAVVCMTQLSIENGEPLYQVGYHME